MVGAEGRKIWRDQRAEGVRSDGRGLKGKGGRGQRPEGSGLWSYV